MRLRAFDEGSAATVSGWAPAPAEAAMWCGSRVAPVPVETVRGWAAEDGVHSFGLYDGADLVGYGELWVDDDEAEVELARLIVDPARRGAGIGRRLVAELLARARDSYPDVFLRVHPDNTPALRCYAAAGFVPVDAGLAAEWNAGQPVRYVWLSAPPDA